MINKILYIALGGGLGAVSRYIIGSLDWLKTPGGFPVGTLSVNLIGCFLIGLIFAKFGMSPKWVSPLVIIGFLGGFTTFSTFGLESYWMLRDSKWLLLGSYVLISNIVGILLVFAGIKAGEFLN